VRAIGFDPDETLRQRASELVDVEETFEGLLDRRPDALIIAGPDEVHLDQLATATSLGITTLVEKPLATRYAVAQDAAAVIKATGVPVLVGYVLRHRPLMQALSRLLRDGVIGRAVSCQVMLGAYGTITVARKRFATAQVDRLYGDYSHEWDYLRWFFGAVTRILAVARTIDTVEHVERPNAVDAVLRFSDPALVAAVHLDYIDPVGLRTIHVVGTEGSLYADVGAGVMRVHRRGETYERFYRYADTALGALGRQAAHLLAVAQGEVAPAVGIDDGLQALAVVDAARESATTGAWVEVGEPNTDGSTVRQGRF